MNIEYSEEQEITFNSMKYVFMEFVNDEDDERDEMIDKFRNFLIALFPNLENPIQVNDDDRSKVIFESRLVISFDKYDFESLF